MGYHGDSLDYFPFWVLYPDPLSVTSKIEPFPDCLDDSRAWAVGDQGLSNQQGSHLAPAAPRAHNEALQLLPTCPLRRVLSLENKSFISVPTSSSRDEAEIQKHGDRTWCPTGALRPSTVILLVRTPRCPAALQT